MLVDLSYQNVSVLDFIGANDNGDSGDNWGNKMCSSQIITTNSQLQDILL